MAVDLFISIVFLLSLWIGWSIRISINWLQLAGIILFSALITTLLPYFVSFVNNSSADFPTWSYYVFGIVLTAMIFMGLYLFLKRNRAPSSGIRRLTGSLVLALLSAYSLIIVLVSIGEYGWIDISDSRILAYLPEWMIVDVRDAE